MLWKCGFYPWRYDSLLIIPFLFNFIYIANLCIWPWGATLAHLQPQPRAGKNAHSTCVVSVPKKNQPIELNDYQLVALTSLTRLSMSRTPYNPDYNHSQDPFLGFLCCFYYHPAPYAEGKTGKNESAWWPGSASILQRDHNMSGSGTSSLILWSAGLVHGTAWCLWRTT